MQTKEELVRGLENAVKILYRAESLQTNIDNVEASIRGLNARPDRKLASHLGIGRTIFLGVIVAYIIETAGKGICRSIGMLFYWLFGDSAVAIYNVWYICVLILCTFFARKLLNKCIDVLINKKITAKNNEKHAKIEGNLEKKEQLLQQFEQVREEYNREIPSWYPDTYSYSRAAEFLLQSIQDGRAETLKEAMNLYETYMHQQRMEQSQQRIEQEQKEQSRQQRLQTLLMVGGFSSLNKNIAADREVYYDQQSGSFVSKKKRG